VQFSGPPRPGTAALEIPRDTPTDNTPTDNAITPNLISVPPWRPSHPASDAQIAAAIGAGARNDMLETRSPLGRPTVTGWDLPA